MTAAGSLAPTPPRGWNSYDCFGGEVTEDEVRANAHYLAEHLLAYGWEYVVVDIAWHSRRSLADLDDDVLDDYGRLLPHPARFPSAAGGQGFGPLAEVVHGLGLKFGIHLMPGIPRRAVARGCAVLGTDRRAGDIADPHRVNCLWPEGLPLVDLGRADAQAYYDSLFRLYADWGVDLVKADGVGYPYLPDQVAALDLARRRCGRPLVLSISAGCPEYTMYARHRQEHCEMWRNSQDFWDRWDHLESQFANCRAWQDVAGPEHWQDADMLPLGRIGIRQHPVNGPDRMTRFSRDEQVTLMSLWSIAQSPLMFGGHLPSNDAWTLALLSHDEVLAVNADGRRGRELFRDCNRRCVAWLCDLVPDDEWALSLTNFDGVEAREALVPLREVGLPPAVGVRDLWARRDLDNSREVLSLHVPPHGTRLLRLRRLSGTRCERDGRSTE